MAEVSPFNGRQRVGADARFACRLPQAGSQTQSKAAKPITEVFPRRQGAACDLHAKRSGGSKEHGGMALPAFSLPQAPSAAPYECGQGTLGQAGVAAALAEHTAEC